MSNAIQTQYNPNRNLNEHLLAVGASKTVYALVTPETEKTKRAVLSENETLEQCREAWTGKQDAYHEIFFDTWHEWAKPVVDLDRSLFPFYYPTNGASEALRHVIFNHAARLNHTIHVFEGEYEGYKAMGEAAGLIVKEHTRDGVEGWATVFGGRRNRIESRMGPRDLFFISQPAAIDGMVWRDFNEFIASMPPNSVVVDLTYVGAVPENSIGWERFNMNAPAVHSVIFSLSKPFGAYYDRIGGIFTRKEDPGLFGNKWFKNLLSLRLGTRLMQNHDVFYMSNRCHHWQQDAVLDIGEKLGFRLRASDVYMLARGQGEGELAEYVRRTKNGDLRLCLTPFMARKAETVGPIS